MKKILLDLKKNGCDVDGALSRMVDDEDLYLECLDEFIKDENMTNISKLIKTDDYESIFNYAHTLKGVSANLGLTQLYEKTCVLVEKLKVHDYEYLEKSFYEMENSYKIFMKIYNENNQ